MRSQCNASVNIDAGFLRVPDIFIPFSQHMPSFLRFAETLFIIPSAFRLSNDNCRTDCSQRHRLLGSQLVASFLRYSTSLTVIGAAASLTSSAVESLRVFSPPYLLRVVLFTALGTCISYGRLHFTNAIRKWLQLDQTCPSLMVIATTDEFEVPLTPDHGMLEIAINWIVS